MLPLVACWSYGGSLGPCPGGRDKGRAPLVRELECLLGWCYCVHTPGTGQSQGQLNPATASARLDLDQSYLTFLKDKDLTTLYKLSAVCWEACKHTCARNPGDILDSPFFFFPTSNPFPNCKQFYFQNISFIGPLFFTSDATRLSTELLQKPPNCPSFHSPLTKPLKLSESPFFTPDQVISCLTHFTDFPLHLG